MEFFQTEFYHNTVDKWLYAILLFIIVLTALRISFRVIYKRVMSLAKKTSTDIDDLVADLLDKIKFFFLFFIAIYFSTLILTLPPNMEQLITKIAIIALLIQGAIWGSGIITYWIGRYKKKKEGMDAASITTFSALGFMLQIALWSIIALLALDNLGVDITALVAGLGIGGVAIALAMQNILGDLFASLSIVLDKPFVIGDFIIVDDYLGAVEHIGLKTTRIRSLSGEQLVFSNNDLLKSRIRNYKRMYERRVLFGIGVIYQTPPEKLELIPKIIREIVESQENTRFDRSHFKEFGDFSLNFETVYWVKDADYNLYMDIHQAINLQIYRRFEKEGIEFAYPSQTLFLNNEGGSSIPQS